MRRFISIAILALTACGSAQYRGPEGIPACEDAARIAQSAMSQDPNRNITASGVQRMIGHYRTCISEIDKDSQKLLAEQSGDFWETTVKVAVAFLVGLIGGAAAAGH